MLIYQRVVSLWVTNEKHRKPTFARQGQNGEPVSLDELLAKAECGPKWWADGNIVSGYDLPSGNSEFSQ